jgi:hypothetical protein
VLQLELVQKRTDRSTQLVHRRQTDLLLQVLV